MTHKKYADVWFTNHFISSTSTNSHVVQAGLFANFFTGEEKPVMMKIWLALLVIAVHVWLFHYLSRPLEPLIEAKPLPMEVKLITIPAPEAANAQPEPEQITPPQPQKIEQPKPIPKPKPKPTPKPIAKPKPVLKKPEPIKKTEPKAESLPKPAAEPEVVDEAPPKPAPVVAPAPSKISPPKQEHFTQANYHANYGSNPKPEYPRSARAQHEEGKVLLRVQVSAEGESLAVHVQHSSGFEALDEAAVAAVERWKFIPAKRGDTAVASTVIVPIIFSLEN